MRRRRQPIKPNRTTPVLGLAIGAIFTCAGLLVLIPHLGATGIYWTLASLVGTIACAIQLFRSSDKDEEDPSWEEEDFLKGFPNEPNFGPPSEEENLDPVTKRLIELQSLYVNKALTREEYQQGVQEITDETKGKDE